jgi:hypothetical protein
MKKQDRSTLNSQIQSQAETCTLRFKLQAMLIENIVLSVGLSCIRGQLVKRNSCI